MDTEATITLETAIIEKATQIGSLELRPDVKKLRILENELRTLQEALEIAGRVTAKPARKPRTKKNGLAGSVLGEKPGNSLATEPAQP